MYQHRTQVRVRYAETDKMGYLYYGNYAAYYEVGRVEAMRALGISYRDMEEEQGILMPVVHMQVRYLRPARYDDLLTLETSILNMPASSVTFQCLVYDAEGQLLNQGQVKLCFLEAASGQRIDAPGYITERLRPYFE